MGGAPGITNVMARALADPLDRVDSIRVYNAGADEQKYDSPIAYTFSIATILDELTMPPIAFEKGRYVEKPMLSDPEPGEFPSPIGKIVLRHSIHSELGTLAESFRKKGVREVFFKINYEPQLVNLVRNLVDTGFTEPRTDCREWIARGSAADVACVAAETCNDEDAAGCGGASRGRYRAGVETKRTAARWKCGLTTRRGRSFRPSRAIPVSRPRLRR